MRIEDYLKEEKSFGWFPYIHEPSFMPNLPFEIKDKIDFLTKKLNFSYGQTLYQDNPFEPRIVWADGSGSVTVDDLTEEDSACIVDLLKYTSDEFLLAKLFDVLGILTDNNDYKVLSAEHHYNFFKQCITNDDIGYQESLKRFLFLMLSTKMYDCIEKFVDEVLDNMEYVDDDQKLIVIYYVSDFCWNYRKHLMSKILTAIEKFIQAYSNVKEIELDLVKIIIAYYKSRKEKDEILKWQNKYADICEELNDKMHPHGYKYIKKAIKELDGVEHEERINTLRFLLDDTQKKLFDSFTFTPHKISDEIGRKFDRIRDNFENQLNDFEDAPSQFLFLMSEFNPTNSSTIEHELKSRENFIFTRIAREVQFGSNQNIIYDSSEANEDTKLEHDIAEIYRRNCGIYTHIMLYPFIKNLIIDDELKEIITDIINHNLLVPSERRKTVANIIINALNKEIRRSLYDLISQFEYGCREYLKNYKKLYPKITKGSMTTTIDLNHMFVVKKDKTNKFRSAICEVLGEDLTLEIEYLSCRPLSANLRNRNYHDGYNNTDQYSCEEIVLLFLMIKAYCLGYDQDLD